MQQKTSKRKDNLDTVTLKRSPKAIPPPQISPNESAKNSNNSTRFSQRSSSIRKIFIPKSHKLNFFFQQPPQKQVRKSFTSVSEANLAYPSGSNISKFSHRPEKLELIKVKVNRDYFDEGDNFEQRNQLTPNNQIFRKPPQYDFRAKRKQQSQINPIGYCQTNRDNSQTIRGIKSQNEINPKRVRSPKALVYPIEKIMQKSRVMKTSSVRSFEYTFGLS